MGFEKNLESKKCKKYITIGLIIDLAVLAFSCAMLFSVNISDFSFDQKLVMYIDLTCIASLFVVLFGFLRQNLYTKSKMSFIFLGLAICLAIIMNFCSWISEGCPEYRLITNLADHFDLLLNTAIDYCIWCYIIFSYSTNERKIIKNIEIVIFRILIIVASLVVISDVFLGFGFFVDVNGYTQANSTGILFLYLGMYIITISLIVFIIRIKIKKKEKAILLSYIMVPFLGALTFIITGVETPLYYASEFIMYMFMFCNLVIQNENQNIQNAAVLNVAKKELEVARQIQTSVLPVNFEEYNHFGVDIFAYMRAAKEVGGDFYDFFMVDDDKIAFLIADVSGKGVPAAMFMMRTKSIIKNNVKTGTTPGTVLTKANEILSADNKEKMFVTVWLGFVDLKKGKLQFANAGHNLPIIRNGSGEFEFLKNKRNLVLAGMKGYKYTDYEIDIKKDMSIYLYTDGITEARNNDNNMFGDDGLLETLKGTIDDNMKERCSYIIEKLDDFVGDADQFDDITMLTLKINKEDGNSDTIKCNADLESLKKVKEFLENFIRDKDLSRKLEKNIFVITDEIFSNIAFYSRATKTMVSIKNHKDRVYLTFWDDGIAYNPLKKEDPDVNLPAEERQIGGLGLYIVKQMAEDVKYERVSGNNVLKIVLKEKA